MPFSEFVRQNPGRIGSCPGIRAPNNLAQAKHPYTRGLLTWLPSLIHPNPRLPVLSRDAAWLQS